MQPKPRNLSLVLLGSAFLVSLAVALYGSYFLFWNVSADLAVSETSSVMPTPNVNEQTGAERSTAMPIVTQLQAVVTEDVSQRLTPTTIPVEDWVSLVFSGYTNPQPPAPEVGHLAVEVFGGALPVEIEIGSIAVSSPIVPVGWSNNSTGANSWDSPENAVGFAINSAAPEAQGNTVLYAHNNVLGQVFRDLDQLRPGNLIVVRTDDGNVWEYLVEDVVVFDESDVDMTQRWANLREWFASSDSSQLTLMTCWPYTGNSHRVAVRAVGAST